MCHLTGDSLLEMGMSFSHEVLFIVLRGAPAITHLANLVKLLQHTINCSEGAAGMEGGT